jgi:predicted MPP superfamily phosphohydrolase
MPFFVLSFLLHGYIGLRVVPALSPWPVAQAALLGVLAGSAVLMPMSFLGRRRLGRGALAGLLTWVGLVCMGLFSSLLVFTFLRDVALLAAEVAHTLWPGALVPDFAFWSAVAVPALGLVATLWGFLNARRTAAVVRVDVPIQGLPAALQGFTVAQISDVHVGPTIRRGYLRRIVRVVNSLKADMVAITGDLVDGRVPELAEHVAPLAELSSRHGTYFVTGNHEYYSGANAWIGELRRLGVHVLLNEHVVLQHAGGKAAGESAPVVVAGVTDFSAHQFDPSHRSDPEAALAGAPTEAGVRMLLAHQPRSAPAAAEAGFQLQLSGHTHGGQFFPWNFFVRLQQPFTAGLHRLKDLWVYTSRGTGYWGPPKRFGAPSEITRLRLVAA